MPELENVRWEKFAQAYAASPNATEAARCAGFKQPHVQGPRLLAKVVVQARLKELTVADSSRRIATAKDRQEFWTRVMEGLEGEDVRMPDRLKASELLGKAQGDFLERMEVTGKNGKDLFPAQRMDDDELAEAAARVVRDALPEP